MTAKSESIQLRSSEFYKENGIEIQVSKEVKDICILHLSIHNYHHLPRLLVLISPPSPFLSVTALQSSMTS